MKNLKIVSKNIRKLILSMAYKHGSGHLGGSLSCTDILASLYFDVMNFSNNLNEPSDLFVLSKGHCSMALYATLAERNIIDKEILDSYGKINSKLQTHPDSSLLPIVNFSTGSLGQGISGAVGIALGAKLNKKDFVTYCLIGDGESQEGQVWEAADMASKYNLDNLVVIMDNNKLQQYGWGKGDNRESPIKEPISKWTSFGWYVLIINGHSHEDIIWACKNRVKNKPTLIIAETIKGKGVSFMENNYKYHSFKLTEEDYLNALEQLEVN